MSTMQCALWSLVMLTTPASALAAGTAYAVLPTQAVGAVAEVPPLAQVMHLALQQESAALVSMTFVEAGMAACSLAEVACARLVGAQTGATHAVLSQVWDQAGVTELKVAIVDVQADLPPEWHAYRAKSAVELTRLAKWAVLSLVVPDALAGQLSIGELEAGADVIVDGVARGQTPLMAPLRLTEGHHEVEIRLGTNVPLRQNVVIQPQASTVLDVCVRGDALRTDCAEARRFFVLTTLGGALGIGVGTVAGAVSGVSFLEADAASKDFAADRNDGTAVSRWQTVGAVAGIGAGVLLVGGAGAITVGLLTE